MIILKKKKCWVYGLEAIGTDIVNVAKSVEYKIFIINKNKIQLSILHKFSYNSDLDYINKFNINKKKVFKKLIQFIEQNPQK